MTVRRSFEEIEKDVESRLHTLPYLKAGKISPREYIYTIYQIDAWLERIDAAEAQRDANQKILDAVKVLIK